MKKILALACVAAVLGSALWGADTASAAKKNAEGVTVTSDYAAKKQALYSTVGEITEIDGNIVTVEGEGYYDCVKALLRSRTYLVQAEGGRTVNRSDLQPGDKVTVYYEPYASRSIPPQVQCAALILGEAKEGRCVFYPVASVKIVGDKATKGSYAVLENTAGDLVATVTEFALEDYDEIEAGDNLLLWYEIQTMSIPARTNASKAVRLSQK